MHKQKSTDEPTQVRSLTHARTAKKVSGTSRIEHPKEESICAGPAERDPKLKFAMKKHMPEKRHSPAQNVTRISAKKAVSGSMK